MALESLGENLWGFQYEASLFPGASFPTRSVLYKQADGKLFIFSPGPFDEETCKEIESLSDEIVLVSPNMVHHLHLKKCYERWPNRPVYGRPELWEKKQPWLKGILKDIKHIHQDLDPAVKALFVRGVPFLSETVFYIAQSKTLIVTDLIFNMDDTVSFGTKYLLKMVGAYNKPAQSRLITISTKNKEHYRSSIEAIMQLDFERVIPSHGAVIETGDDFRKALTY